MINVNAAFVAMINVNVAFVVTSASWTFCSAQHKYVYRYDIINDVGIGVPYRQPVQRATNGT